MFVVNVFKVNVIADSDANGLDAVPDIWLPYSRTAAVAALCIISLRKLLLSKLQVRFEDAIKLTAAVVTPRCCDELILAMQM